MIGAFSHRCNSRHRLAESFRRCASPKAITWSTHSRRIDPINLSAKPFCQGEPGAMGLSRMPMARNRCMTADAPILGCADPTRCRGHWPHTQPPRPGRIASSICADLICDRDKVLDPQIHSFYAAGWELPGIDLSAILPAGAARRVRQLRPELMHRPRGTENLI
jgi:hypothetical protein